MNAKHTPPPWEWVGSSLEGPEYKSVLEVQQLPERAWPEMQMGELVMCNEEGDKPLIAAAPDMLEACKAALERLGDEYPPEMMPVRSHEGSCHPDAGCDGLCADLYHAVMHNAAVRKIRVAIAKAKGESE